MPETNFFLEIESDPANLITVEEFINYIAAELQITDQALQGLLLSVTEATTNAILHANKGNKTKKVTLTGNVENDMFRLCIKDEGEGFDPNAVPDPTQPENLFKETGRGLYLMRFYMDKLVYNHTPTGMETILVMNIAKHRKQ